MDYDLRMAIIALLIAFFANLLICPVLIPFLHKLKFGQNIRSDGPQTHLKKAGTPTMGGLAILVSFLISTIFFLGDNPEAILLISATIGFGIIGFLDDYLKIVKKRSEGLTPKQKFVLQFLMSAGFLYFLMQIDDPANSFRVLTIPFVNLSWDMGILFYPFAAVFMVGFVNAVNLTDGLDGLAAGVTAIVCTFFMFGAWAITSSILPMTGAAVGSLLGFLIFNTHPARVFMGDTGSLALGGFVAAAALILRMPLLLVIVGFIYVVEVLSVTIQVFYFKATGGKRFFEMAPLHHHYEKKGVSETKIVIVFYIITTILCLVGYLISWWN
ncbi:MAG: phospho-N-acetylmuramoyl-pentapeptide-transferase [Defluviitaleaceae bacterium]|nr:phospho-N-acetylmuramoyl-pentapeptide-transferase [Defluviitaleaceae bacterium]